METRANYISGSFRDRENAERAYNQLRERGYSDDEINIIMSDKTRSKYFDNTNSNASQFDDKAKKEIGKGTAIGGAVGAAAGIITAIGASLALPGLGLVIAGPIAAGLVGAGAGGLLGAMIAAGIPEDRAKIYQKRIDEGDIVIGFMPKTEDDASVVGNDWRQYQATDVY